MLRSSEAKESRACPGRDKGHRRRQASPTPSTARVVEAQEPSERGAHPRLADQNQNHGTHRLVDMLLKIEGMRIAVVDFVVVWRMGSLMSTNKEAHSARGELLAAQKGLVGRHGSDEISVVGLEACGEQCCQLSKVDLSFCKKLTDAGVMALCQGGCPQLSCLNLTWCCEITDAGVIALGQGGCPQLSSLNLSYCDRITDAGVIALCQGGCPQLSSLNLKRCVRITDAGVMALGQGGCPQLSSLNLSYCEQITDEGMMAIKAAGL